MAEINNPPLTPNKAGFKGRSKLSKETLVIGLILLILACVPIGAQLSGEQFYIRLVMRMMIFALMAISLNLVLGYGGLVSFGHAMFVGTAAYVVGILGDNEYQGVSFVLGWLEIPGSLNALVTWSLAILLASLLALVVGLIALRTSGLYFIMTTLALAQMAYFVTVSLEDYGGVDGLQLMGDQTLGPFDLSNRLTIFYIALAALAFSLWVSKCLIHSRFGLVLRASKQNALRLEAIGVPVFTYRLIAFVISGAIAGLAGVLLATSQAFVSPADLSWVRSGELIVMVVLGGMGTLLGPLLGAFFFLSMEYLLGAITQHWAMIMGPLLIIVVLFARRGLISLFQPGSRSARSHS